MSGRLRPAEDPASIDEGARLLREGGVVAFPTETVYGLGANAFDPTAVARVYEVKARPSFDPLIVHLAAAADLDRVSTSDDPRVQRLAARFWPGPLTLVLPRLPDLPEIVTAGLVCVFFVVALKDKRKVDDFRRRYAEKKRDRKAAGESGE